MLVVRNEFSQLSHCSQLGFLSENPSARLSSLAQLPAQQQSWDLVTAQLPWGRQDSPGRTAQAGPGLAPSTQQLHVSPSISCH